MTTEHGDGYLKIGNKTIDNLIDNKKFSSKVRAYFLTVRMLNGWDNESLKIPVSTYSNRLGISERYAKEVLKALQEEGLIHRNWSLTTIPGDYAQWWWSCENIAPPGGEQFVSKGVSKKDTKRVSKKLTLNTPTLQINTPSVSAAPLSRKEIDKLEGMAYFRAEMINDGGFKIKFIDDLIEKYPFMVLYDSWLEYVESSNIKSKPGFFYSLVEKYQEREKKKDITY